MEKKLCPAVWEVAVGVGEARDQQDEDQLVVHRGHFVQADTIAEHLDSPDDFGRYRMFVVDHELAAPRVWADWQV
jgi:hypothetical protein